MLTVALTSQTTNGFYLQLFVPMVPHILEKARLSPDSMCFGIWTLYSPNFLCFSS